MKGLGHDAGEPHVRAWRYLDALLERRESIAHDAHLMPPGRDRQGRDGRMADEAAVDVQLTPRRRPHEQAPRRDDGRPPGTWRRERRRGVSWRRRLYGCGRDGRRLGGEEGGGVGGGGTSSGAGVALRPASRTPDSAA